MRRMYTHSLCMSLLLVSMTGCSFAPSFFDVTPDTASDSTRAWWTEDGLVKPDYKLVAFAAYGWLDLEQDFARGEGEHLASLASVLGVEGDSRLTFEAAAQQRFEAVVPPDRTIHVQQLRALVK